MRHFYKALVGPPDIPLVTEIMRRQDELFDEKGAAKELPQGAKTLSLGIMQVTNSPGLIGSSLWRLPHDSKQVWNASPGDHFIKVLNGQIMCMVGDECPAMNTGEWWWLDSKQDAILINKSGDDALMLCVNTKVD